MIPTEQLWKHYLVSKSVWKTGAYFGLAGQTVHERLKRYGYKLYGEKYSEKEDTIIREAYKKSEGMRTLELEKLADKLGRPHHSNVSRRARELGLTDSKRKHTIKQKDENAKRMLEAMQAGTFNWSYKNIQKGWYTSSKGEKYYLKSSWETAYAKYLDNLLELKAIEDWSYEPDIFWFEKIKRGVRSYTPDFKIVFTDGDIQYHEVKGYLDSKSKTKIKRMRIYHPEVVLVVIGKSELKALGLI